MKEYYRKVSKIVFWILLFSGTFIIGEQSDVIEIETLQASSFVGEAYEAEDAATQGITNTTQTHVLVVDVDAACANETVSLVKLLEDISDAGLLVKVPGLKTDTLTLRIIDQLTRWMTSSSTDVLEKNLFEVIELYLPNTHIHVISNAHGSTGSTNSPLLRQISQFGIIVDVWVIDECKKAGHRHKRQSATNIYQQLAQQSGGLVINTNKGNIASVANLLKQTTKANTVDIMRFTNDKPMMSSFLVPVDDSITQLTVLLTSPNSAPVCMAMMPLGNPAPFGRAGSGYSIQNVDYGNWKFQKVDSSTWDVKVTAQSNLGFTYQFLQPGPGGFGQYPIKGRPIAGESYKLSITVPQCTSVANVSTALFLNDKGFPTKTITLKNVGGRRGKCIFYEQITMPPDSFHLAVEGKDKTNHLFRRFEPLLIQPISVKLIVPSFSGVKLYKNEFIDIPFTVINAGSKQQDIDVKIEDDKKFAQAPLSLAFLIPAKANKTGKFKIKGGLIIGETTTVTITAKPYIKGKNIPGQYEVRRFTVEDRPKNKTKDTIDPTCNVTNVVGTCNIGSDLCACVNHTWSMDVVVGDEGFGLRQIFPNGAGSNQSFTHDNFQVGHNISMGVIHASLGADCCHQMATIQVVDDAGNVASCSPNISQNFKPPDPSHCNNTNMNITIPCNRTAITGSCGNFPSNPCDCHNKGYHIEAEFGSVGWNLFNAFTRHAGNNASLVKNGNIIELDSDCCYQQIIIVAEDIAGNIGQCNVSIGTFPTPKPGDCTTTTTSTSTTTTPTTTTITTTPSATKSSVTVKASTSAGATQLKGSSSLTTASQGKPTASTANTSAASKSSDANSSNGDHLTTGAVAGAMVGAGVVALTALIVMGVVVWKALSKAKSVEPVAYNRRRDNSWT